MTDCSNPESNNFYVMVNHSHVLCDQDFKYIAAAIRKSFLPELARTYEQYIPGLARVSKCHASAWPVPHPIPDPTDHNLEQSENDKPKIPLCKEGLVPHYDNLECKNIIPIYILDNPPAYVTDSDDGRGFVWIQGDVTVIYVFVNRAQDILYNPKKPNDITLSQTISKLIANSFTNPYTTRYFQQNNFLEVPDVETNYVYANIGDPVQSNYWLIKVEGQCVKLSDFVLLQWFNPLAPPNQTVEDCQQHIRFNYLNTLNAPYELGNGEAFYKLWVLVFSSIPPPPPELN